MNQKKNKLFVRFAPETRFAATPAAPFRTTQENELERLKAKLLADQLLSLETVELSVPLRRAANEAAAIAWATLFPLLVFPALFEEKATDALRQAARQARIFRNSRELLAA